MRKLLFATPLFLISFSPTLAQTVDEIIARHLEAMGGAKRLKAVQTVRMARISADKPENGDSTILSKKRGSKFRLEQAELRDGVETRTVQGCDGKTSWSVNSHIEIEAKPGRRIIDAPPQIRKADEFCKEQADIDGPLVEYRQKGDSLTLAGKQMVEGREAYDLKVKNANNNGPATHFYVDTKNFLLVKIAREADGSHTEDLYSDYRSVDGMMVPFLWDTRWWAVRKDPALEEKAAAPKIAGPEGSNKQIVKSIKFNIPLADSLFTPPSDKATPGTNPQPANKK